MIFAIFSTFRSAMTYHCPVAAIHARLSLHVFLVRENPPNRSNRSFMPLNTRDTCFIHFHLSQIVYLSLSSFIQQMVGFYLATT